MRWSQGAGAARAQPGLNSPPRSRGRAAASYGSTVRLQGFRKPGLVDTLIDTGSTRSHCQDPGQPLSVFSLLPFWVDFFFWFVLFGLLFFQMAMTQPFPAALRVSWFLNRLFLGQ